MGIGVGSAGQFSVNGFRGRSNNFTVDGSDNNDEDIGMRRQGFLTLVPQTFSSLQDFQIQTAGFLSEFGRNAGSMVNAVSRSGTLEHHGNLYAAFSDDAVNARNFFDQSFSDDVNSASNSGGRYPGEDFAQQIYGGSLGGPLVPRRLFYFLAGEHLRENGARLGHFVVPTQQERGLRINPDFTSPSGIQGFVPIDELSEFFSDRFVPIPYSADAGLGVFGLYPLPNNPGGPFGESTYSQAQSDRGRGVVLSGKLDWNVSNAHTVTGRYNFTQDESAIPFTGDSINSAIAADTRTQNLSTFVNSVFGGKANLLRFSYGRTRLGFLFDEGSRLLFGSPPVTGAILVKRGALPPGVVETPFGRFGPFGATGPVGQLTIVPYSTVGVDVFNFPQGRVNNTFQVSDNFTWLGDAHTLQVGFDFRFSQLNSFSDRNSRPAYVFSNGLVDDLDCGRDPDCLFNTVDGLLRGTDLASLGAAAGALQTLSTTATPDSAIGLRLASYEFFVQDSWRPRPRLTINLGLRYEYQTPPREENNRIEDTFGLSPEQFGRLDPADPRFAGVEDDIREVNDAFDAALLALQGFLGGRGRIYDPDKNNLAPRIGLAWDPFGDARTSVRAGYGIFYDSNLGAVTSQSRNVFPTFVPINLDPSFDPPDGQDLNSPFFFVFDPTNESLVSPGTLNTYGLGADSFATGLGALLTQTAFPGLDELLRSGNGLAFTLPEKDLDSGYGQHFVLSIERQFGDYLGSVSYVGTRGLHLTRFTTPNGGLVSTPVLLFPFGEQLLTVLSETPRIAPGIARPQPELGAYTVFENTARSNYHSLQTSFEKRLDDALRFRINWTWSHAIDEVSDPFDGRGFFALPQDSTRLRDERAAANFDVRHRVSFFARWDLPRWRGPLLRDWTFSAIGNFYTGQPFTVNTSWDRNGDGNLTDRPDSSAGLLLQPDTPRPIRLGPDFDPIGFEDLFSSGKLGRNTFRADGIAKLDLSLSRRLPLRDAAHLDFRIEVFNVFNHTSFGIPVRILESPGFGRSFDTQLEARQFRFWLKLDF